jgi:cobalt/nickel transport system permease protein
LNLPGPTQAERPASAVQNLDARVKILCAVFFAVLVVSAPIAATCAFPAYFFFIVLVTFISRVSLYAVLKRLLVIMLFAGMIAVFIPFLTGSEPDAERLVGWGGLSVSPSGLRLMWSMIFKAFLAGMGLILLTLTTPFPKILEALTEMHVPRLFVMMTGFAYRYVFVLGDEISRMLRAADCRGYGGRWLWHAKLIGSMAGMLFLRSYERGERVYFAMLARGFDGRAPLVTAMPLNGMDFLAGISVICTLLAARFCL